MTSLPPPVVLVFAPHDPTGAMYLPADAISCAMVGCHALSVITATHLQDTMHTEHITLSSPDVMHDQMRCLLEDINVHSIKAGPIYSIDSASVLAQVAADYAALPLILHLQSIPDETILTNESDPDEITDAIFQLVLPQTNVVIADNTLLMQWQSDGLLDDQTDPITSLLDYGCEWVFCSSPNSNSQMVTHALYNQDGLQHEWSSPIHESRLQDTEGLLCTLISAYIAQGLDIIDAVAAAITYTDEAATHAFQAGMGARIIHHSV